MSKKRGNTRIEKRTHKKKRNKKRMLLYVILPLVIILLTGGSFIFYLYTTAQNAVNSSHEPVGRENEVSNLRDEAVDPVEDNVSVLIIGVDDSEQRDYQEESRSDALMLATFNKERHDIKLLSIPRDSYVYVPEIEDFTKITHAHFYGGPKATIETVEKFLDVPVDYYARVDFNAFIDVVDTLDGIDFDVPYEISEMDSNDKQDAIHLMPGKQTLDGEQALALARTRKYDSDVDRGKRQQEIVKQIAKKTVSLSSILKLDDLIEAVSDNLATNLSFSNMKSFLSYGIDKNVSIIPVNLEGDGGKKEDGLWYYNVDPESRSAAQKELREQLDLSPDEDYDPNEGVIPYDGTYNPDNENQDGEYDSDSESNQDDEYDSGSEYDQDGEYNQNNDYNQDDGQQSDNGYNNDGYSQ